MKTKTIHEGTSRNWTFHEWHKNESTNIIHQKQCDQMVIYFFKIWPYGTMKIAQNYPIFAKIGSQCCQLINSYSRNGQKLFNFLPKWRKFTKSGHIDQKKRSKLGSRSSSCNQDRLSSGDGGDLLQRSNVQLNSALNCFFQ